MIYKADSANIPANIPRFLILFYYYHFNEGHFISIPMRDERQRPCFSNALIKKKPLTD